MFGKAHSPRGRRSSSFSADLLHGVQPRWVELAAALFRRGWFGRPGKWEISSNAKGLGARVHVVLDDSTGAVLKEDYVPR